MPKYFYHFMFAILVLVATGIVLAATEKPIKLDKPNNQLQKDEV